MNETEFSLLWIAGIAADYSKSQVGAASRKVQCKSLKRVV